MLEQRPDMSLLKRRAARGMTLTEIIVTSALGLIVVLGATQLDVARTMMELNIHQQMAAAQPDRFGAALASLKIAESLTRADRAVLSDLDGDSVYDALQVRVSDCDGSDTACGAWEERHRWEQYNLDTATTPWSLAYYASDHQPNSLLYCGKHRALAQNITGLEFSFEDEETAPPPGGEPDFSPNPPLGGGEDNNMVRYAITWSDGVRTQTFKGEAMTRAQGYTNVTDGGLSDPRFGDPSPPPALCTGEASTARTDRPGIDLASAASTAGPCAGAGAPYCVPDAGGSSICIPFGGTLCTIVQHVTDRERRSYAVDVPAGTAELRVNSIYYDGAPQCGRYYQRITPPDASGLATEFCAGGPAEGGTGICSWRKRAPVPGKWYIDVVGDTPAGLCNETTLVMGVVIS